MNDDDDSNPNKNFTTMDSKGCCAFDARRSTIVQSKREPMLTLCCYLYLFPT